MGYLNDWDYFAEELREGRDRHRREHPDCDETATCPGHTHGVMCARYRKFRFRMLQIHGWENPAARRAAWNFRHGMRDDSPELQEDDYPEEGRS
jgi:hypothetical protein